MDKLTKSEIAHYFELGRLGKKILDNSSPSSFEIAEKRTKGFIDRVLKPWIESILKRKNDENHKANS